MYFTANNKTCWYVLLVKFYIFQIVCHFVISFILQTKTSRPWFKVWYVFDYKQQNMLIQFIYKILPFSNTLSFYVIIFYIANIKTLLQSVIIMYLTTSNKTCWYVLQVKFYICVYFVILMLYIGNTDIKTLIHGLICIWLCNKTHWYVMFHLLSFIFQIRCSFYIAFD